MRVEGDGDGSPFRLPRTATTGVCFNICIVTSDSSISGCEDGMSISGCEDGMTFGPLLNLECAFSSETIWFRSGCCVSTTRMRRLSVSMGEFSFSMTSQSGVLPLFSETTDSGWGVDVRGEGVSTAWRSGVVGAFERPLSSLPSDRPSACI